ncbi:MAG TPA: hypothetical protein VNT56_10575 [Acidimicrobiales bacterium]|jgi:glutamate formiminotransferase / 5-formyltetrahydrofolate cyclo-ligase|nr:hypothetical protein [Acidimicrobiales bacterium]
MVLLCPMNLSEGRRLDLLEALAGAAGDDLLDIHHDGDHHRSVFTMVGEEAPRAVTRAAIDILDLRHHRGAHPRLGTVDVVPFVPLGTTPMDHARRARDRFATWLDEELGVPAFVYGPEGPSLPEIRREAFSGMSPRSGPATPHPRAGATAVGARAFLVAYNLWLGEADLALARTVARDLRSPTVRALGLAVGDAVQVSCNLVDPLVTGPDAVYDAVAARAPVARAELVGLAPRAVLDRIDGRHWARLDLAPERTIEARLARRLRRVGPRRSG